jgi:parvulin-like peptidyl-prolyl isomerase
VPFPVAKVGGSWVSYESYLFQLRRNMHYYVTQQGANFSTKTGKAQLNRLKQQAMSNAIQAALVKKLAHQNNVSVSSQDVNNEVNILKQENRLGSSNHVFNDVLSEYYGWDESDFKRELQQELLQEAVIAKLDTSAEQNAQNALNQLKEGANFATLAGQVSQDPQTKTNGGQYPNSITINDQNISPAITNELFLLKPGQFSGVVNTGYSLDIVKLISKSGDSVTAAHIQFNLQGISTYIQPLEQKQSPHQFIKF